ncbi:helix-turn-helix transcriptional regulator [Spirosoma linguale]|uniref:Transcriptional regulator, AraC family n=1 Tax=Spirosoma linguale (strain ATCC 33905 / DSM 74 / LMG 10896 / Claus 1) TaxID=504472 RepID=D2QEZ5_SPILD|nr:transcriptional regulator, AraC family [Spirosoma linguale DSM 74]
MVFEFAPGEQFNFLAAFANRVGTLLQDATVTLPNWLGTGSIKRVRLTPDFSLLIHQYTLTEELILRRTAADNTADRVNVLFQASVRADGQPGDDNGVTAGQRQEYTVRITSPDIDSELRFPPGRGVLFVVLSMNRSALRQLLGIGTTNEVVEQILQGTQAFLFYETMNAEAHQTLEALVRIDDREELGNLRSWIRVQALLCWLFERLLTRETGKHRPIHRADADQLSRVRAAVVADLRQPPRLAQLALLAGMSTSKLTDLFKQVFGDSIYDYFQKARMIEASHLLRQEGYSVSETGHRLGFSNLSHFSRLFEKHYGIKPKQFARNE